MSSAIRRLIVNADDLGRTTGINQGVAEAHAKGIVTSATLMVNYPAALDVPELSRDHPRLGIGLHVALTGGASTLPASEIPSLLDAGGTLPAKPEGLASLDPDPAHVLAEARAQLARFRGILGRLPTHFDSHHHSHNVPAVFDAIVTLAQENDRPMRSTSPEMTERLRAAGVKTTDRFVDSFFGEGATLATLDRVLLDLEPGVTEIMCHPAYVDDELRSTSGYAVPREGERRALQNNELRPTLQTLGIRLVSFEAL
jgi:chitin disaccharide deacetylase